MLEIETFQETKKFQQFLRVTWKLNVNKIKHQRINSSIHTKVNNCLVQSKETLNT